MRPPAADKWLRLADDHVVAIHCKGGKGRTGTAICAHLIQHWGLTADQALMAYENARTIGWSTENAGSGGSQGVTGQSQIRYVHYYADILAQASWLLFFFLPYWFVRHSYYTLR